MLREDLIWLSGLLEGEGSFLKPPPSSPRLPAIALQMTDEDVVARVADLWGVRYHKVARQKSHHKDTYMVAIKGSTAVRVMKELKPFMGQRRALQIEEAVAAYKYDPPKISEEDVFEIERRYAAGEKAAELANEFGVTKYTVYAI